LNQWNELNVFTGDGAVPIDNNVSEREMKRIVLNRKNSLFVGNERGGADGGDPFSLTSTCRRHGIDPQRYLTQLLTNLPKTPISQWLGIVSGFWFVWELAFLMGVICVFWVMPFVAAALVCWAITERWRGQRNTHSIFVAVACPVAVAVNAALYLGLCLAIQARAM
jgi:hypothetical protein